MDKLAGYDFLWDRVDHVRLYQRDICANITKAKSCENKKGDWRRQVVVPLR